jgi:Nif-specific regulatory protein
MGLGSANAVRADSADSPVRADSADSADSADGAHSVHSARVLTFACRQANRIPDPCRLVDDLSLVFDVYQVLEQSFEPKNILHPVLARIAASSGVQRGHARVVDPASRETAFEASFGPDGSAPEPGPALMREAMESASARVVADISLHEAFADRRPKPAALARGPGPCVSFLCVPLKAGDEILGVLSIERAAAGPEGIEHDLKLLGLIGGVVAQAVRIRQSAQKRLVALHRENERLQEQIKKQFKPGNMIGGSAAMRTVFHHVEQVASSQTTVFIRGESGVGKELVANAIHASSPRAGRAFVKVNCAALPESIVESELFGHEKGAFTGAIAMRRGRFELADGGTIFLDEIGDLSASTQVKLLRVLQEREFERVGGQHTLRCDVRVITATGRNVESLIEEQKFRADLYYRLNVFPIYVPPLRERKADILALADHFVEKYCAAAGKVIRRISTSAIDLMMMYHWPGNVRELENCIERAVLVCRDDAIQAHHLPPTLQFKAQGAGPAKGNLASALNAVELEMLVDALKETGGNMAQAARALGVSERVMGLRVQKHGIELARYRTEQPF